MSDLESFLQRNQAFGRDFAHGELGIVPARSTVVLTCLDARVDPAHFWGLTPGEALVLRNAGGRVTDAVERDLSILWQIGRLQSAPTHETPPELALAIVHHEDCGLERIANPEIRRVMSQRSGIAFGVLGDLAIADHEDALVADVARLARSPIVPDALVVSGHLYDPKTGRVQQVLAPRALGAVAEQRGSTPQAVKPNPSVGL